MITQLNKMITQLNKMITLLTKMITQLNKMITQLADKYCTHMSFAPAFILKSFFSNRMTYLRSLSVHLQQSTSHHITSNHITAQHVTSRHVTSHHSTERHIMSHHTTAQHSKLQPEEARMVSFVKSLLAVN